MRPVSWWHQHRRHSRPEERGIVSGDEGASGGISLASDVLVQILPDGEAIFLNLETEEYFGLDAMGTAMYQALVECGDLETAHQRLAGEFAADPARLRDDLGRFFDSLVAKGLLAHPGR